MATVYFSSEQETLLGCSEMEVETLSYRGLLDELRERLPCFDTSGIESLAFVIDGEIVQEPFLATFRAGSELHFIQKIAAG